MTKPLKDELLAWLEKLKEDEAKSDGRYRNCGQLFRLPNGLPAAPTAPAGTAGMTAESLLELVRQMKPEQKREFARLLFS